MLKSFDRQLTRFISEGQECRVSVQGLVSKAIV